MYYTHAICRRINPAKFGDDAEPSTSGPVTQSGGIGTFSNVEQSGGIGTFSNVEPLPTLENVQSGQAQSAAFLREHPILGSKTSSSLAPWAKGALVIGAIGVGGYALSQVAKIGKVIRG